MRFIMLTIQGSDSGGEGYVEDHVAYLVGNNEQPMRELEEEFLVIADPKTVFRRENESRFNCYRTVFAERFASWLQKEKGFIPFKLETHMMSVIWPHEEKFASEFWEPDPVEMAQAIDLVNKQIDIPLHEPRERVNRFMREGKIFSSLEPPE